MKEIYIIRHGETDFNKQGIIQGRGVNADLNEKGHSQALLFFKAYHHISFDKVYTSTLKRTHQTVQYFLDNGISWDQHEGLDELDWGIYEGKAADKEMRTQFHQLIQNWTAGEFLTKFPGGESPIEVVERQKKALKHIMSNTNEQKVLICMHGRAMRLFLCTLLNRTLDEMESFPHTNLSLYRLSFDGQSFQLIDFNNTDHLND